MNLDPSNPALRVAPGDQRAVAHLVTPYLFLTGGWIHTQLVHNRSFRPVVITQATENETVFPFSPVYNLGNPRAQDGVRRADPLWTLVSKYLLGQFPAEPYRAIYEREKVDLIHAHLGWEGARTVMTATEPKRPFVVSFYGRDAGMLPRSAYWRALYTRLWKHADRFIAEGPFMGETLVKIGAPADRIRVVHLGIPLEQFRFAERSVPPGNAPIIGLIAASFREKKGIPFALQAFARIARRHPRVRLRIIGDGPQRAQIEQLARGPELAGRVDLLGYQPPAVYRAELERAHFFMAPSVTAADGDSEGGAPVCLLEAQAVGLPVVATVHCDIPEVTRENQSAFLAPERNVEALALRLDDLLSDPARWPRMGRAGRAHIEEEFDIVRQVERMNEVYRELL
ncbi:MAG: glycosyltransferase [Candidatus Eisenbacteria bacterium]|nr:glycosyltransferase [Candidatus Eisenbacteria bacterium]MCC7143385.1 glycosyltransferase [Candidatus Eisenbacteria bacterium]